MQVLIPFLDRDGEVDHEVCTARRVDGPGTARLTAIPRRAVGVSIHDTVRFQDRPVGPPRATSVERRAPLVTVRVTGPPAAVPALRRATSSLVATRHEVVELRPGALGIALPRHALSVLLDLAARTPAVGRRGARDDRGRRAGVWRWRVTTSASWPTGALPISPPTVDELHRSPVWHADDEVARRWPAPLRAALRERGTVDPITQAALLERRYLAAVVPLLRSVLAGTYGPQRAHEGRFSLLPGETVEERDRNHVAWREAHGTDGAVRWAVDERVDRDLRAMLLQLGLDPDVDPTRPVASAPRREVDGADGCVEPRQRVEVSAVAV
ncbi:hypothetical protein FTX61_04835 [Nitriliruptoraceae bacterium ZYF776]|nr:hypothetical protein [Profundirhabdus halotolerans]